MVYWSCDTPLVGIVMQHPTIGTIHLACCLTTCHADLTNQAEEGFVQLCEIGDLRGPVIHLQIDVRGVFRVPRREHLLIPDTLQIGWVDIVGL